MEVPVYNQQGKKVGTALLPDRVFNVPWNADLVHQVVTSMQMRKRHPLAHAKGRGEVSGGGRKPWRQKGTGRARHGSIRSPLWVGGGVAHGPTKEKNYFRKVNRKAAAKAFFAILSRKLQEGEILFVDHLEVTEPKTKLAKGMLETFAKIPGFETLATKKKNAAYIALSRRDRNVSKSFANLSNLTVGEFRNLNPVSSLTYKYLLVEHPEEAAKFFEGKLPRSVARGSHLVRREDV